jgi:bifunctional non-homologous end joining protein LigD
MSLRLRTRRARPGFIQPCQPVLAVRPPTGPHWIHEIKHDGYRLIARRDAAGIRLITRNGHDWSPRYPAIIAAVKALKVKSCIIDGEVVVAREDGVTCFNSLRSGSRVKPDAALCAFDLIELDSEDLRRVPIEERKRLLLRLLRVGKPGLQYNEHVEGDSAIVFRKACQLGLEGIVSKRKGSSYISEQSRDWLKSKNPESPAVRREAEEEWGCDTFSRYRDRQCFRRRRTSENPAGVSRRAMFSWQQMWRG